MFRITLPKDNAVSATYQYLKAIGAKVTEETVEETLKNHPDYPSLLAVSDALNEWKVENLAISITSEQILEIPTPFLVHLQRDKGIFAIVKSIENNKIKWRHTEKGIQNESFDEFNKKWDGVVLVAEANEKSIENNYSQNHQKELIQNFRIPALIIGITILITSVLYRNFISDWQYNALLITKLLGTIISSLLIWQSIDKNNPFIQTLCKAPTNAGKSGEGCSSILNSKAAQITSWLNWSEVGFLYFLGGFIALLIDSSIYNWVITGIATLAIGYSFWSIYYQGFISKKWCTLCLGVQSIVIIEFFISIYSTKRLSSYLVSMASFSAIWSMVFGIGVAILFWLFLKPILQKSQQIAPLKNDLRKFKNNPELFMNLLKNQEQMPFITHYLQPVLIGNPEAEHTITMVTNPFCQPCANTHKTIQKLLENNENLNCEVIFLATNHEHDKKGLIARIILSLSKEQQADALHAWYENEERNINKWQNQLGIAEDKRTEKIIQYHEIWCKEARVEGTPTLYLDGFKLPDLYRLEDLKGVLKYLPRIELKK